MKLTTAKLKQMIKEELDNVVTEQQDVKITDADLEAGKEMQNTPIGNAVFKALDKDPKVQQAIEKMSGMLNEENVGGQYAMMGGLAGATTVGTEISAAMWTGLLSKTGSGALMGALKALGIAAPAIAGGMLAGYLIYKLGSAAIEASKKDKQ